MRKQFIIITLICLMLTSCTSPDKTIRVLQEEGYNNIQITGYRHWSCSNDDSFKTGFKAVNRNQKTVTGTVCSGWLKGSTIRLD